jgi:hypothetical protein
MLQAEALHQSRTMLARSMMALKDGSFRISWAGSGTAAPSMVLTGSWQLLVTI